MQGIKDWRLKPAPKHKLIVQFIKFYAFSMLVTMFQYLALTFLPGTFYRFTDWCDVPCQLTHPALGPVNIYVFSYPATGDVTGGMGCFAASAITLSLAQCTNFPMQKNTTFRSKENVYYQVTWHAVTFVLIAVACSFLMGLYVPFCEQYSSLTVYSILITAIDGRVQMMIYFPIYKIISLESEAKPGG